MLCNLAISIATPEYKDRPLHWISWVHVNLYQLLQRSVPQVQRAYILHSSGYKEVFYFLNGCHVSIWKSSTQIWKLLTFYLQFVWLWNKILKTIIWEYFAPILNCNFSFLLSSHAFKYYDKLKNSTSSWVCFAST